MENDLAYWFGISQPTVLYMDHYFDEFMPEVFKDSYPKYHYQQHMTCV